MTVLSESSATALEQARVWAAHRDELELFESHGWQFGMSDTGTFLARRTSGRGDVTRLYADSLDELLEHIWLKQSNRKPKGETDV